jgi:uncharacterized membrane protein YeaQ/YmgE (transglycosylase-associated protein family)
MAPTKTQAVWTVVLGVIGSLIADVLYEALDIGAWTWRSCRSF